MAWIVQFESEARTSTVDLNDQTETFVNIGGFQAPPPSPRHSMAGNNLFRHGQNLIRQRYGNRQVRMSLDLKGTNATSLGTVVQNIWGAIRDAREYEQHGVGTRVQLKYQWDGAPGPVYFNVLDGALDLGSGLHSEYLRSGTRIRNATLTLICEPFAYGTAESLQNYLKDPSAEIAATELSDWIKDDGTGTIVRTTAHKKYGTASIEIRRTGGTATNEAKQELTASEFTGSDNIAASVWVRPQDLDTTIVAMMRVDYLSTAGTAITGSLIATTTAVGTAFVQLVATGTVPTDVGTTRYYLRISDGTGTGTVQFDGAYLGKDAAVPTAWISGRDVANHYDDNGQAHINYADLFDVPGDMPALLQVKANENENHQDLWVGARHGGNATGTNTFLEAEDRTGSVGNFTVLGGTALHSNATAMRWDFTSDSTGIAANDPFSLSFDLADAPKGAYRVVTRAGLELSNTAGTAFLSVGYSYGGATVVPTASSDYTVIGTERPFMHTDIGALVIPPVAQPAGGTLGTFTVHVRAYHSTDNPTNTRLVMDSIALVPADNGFSFADKGTGRTDVVWFDSRSNLRAAYLMTTADVVSQIPADQQGTPPEADPDSTRLYFIIGSGTATSSIAHGAKVAVTYVPRYLHVSQ